MDQTQASRTTLLVAQTNNTLEHPQLGCVRDELLAISSVPTSVLHATFTSDILRVRFLIAPVTRF